MSTISPSTATTPLQLARVYGLPSPRAGEPVAPAAGVQTLRQTDRADIAARVGPAAGKASELVAGVVPGRAEFAPAAASTGAAGSLPFYRAPSDRNAAATAILLGRSLDVSG